MTNPIFGNPIRGVLHPLGWTRPPGNTDMVVTQDAASHAAQIDPITGKHRPMALDIGDGDPDRDTLVAAHDCRVVGASTVGSANLTLEFVHGGVAWRMVYAHDTLPHPVSVGQVLAEGDAVGHMGNTSSPSMPVAIHLHWQVGYWDGTKWVWVDPSPLLAQNQETDMLAIETVTLLEGGPRQFLISAGSTINGYDPARPGGPIVSRTFSTASSAPADARVRVEWPGANPLPIPNGYPFLRCTAGVFAGLLVVEGQVKLESVSPVPINCDAEVKAAVGKAVNALTDAYEARITGIKAKVASGASDVADD